MSVRFVRVFIDDVAVVGAVLVVPEVKTAIGRVVLLKFLL